MTTPEKLYHGQDNLMPMSFGHERITKRALVEVFSVKMIATKLSEVERIGGFILLNGSDKNYVLYENTFDNRGPQFDSEGYLTLIGPERSVEVKNRLVVYPWLFDKISCLCEKSNEKILWMKDPQLPRTNQVIRKGFRTKLGVIKVDFAVYSDGVEARIEIFLLDMEEELLSLEKPLEIYGTVKASNSVVVSQSNARSTLLDNITSQRSIKLSSCPSGGSEISVPLTRNVVVIPRKSTLIVDVVLSLHCIPCSKSVAVAVGSVTFDASSRSICTVEEKIILGPRAKVKVKAHWST